MDASIGQKGRNTVLIESLAIGVVRWVARVLALAMFLFLGWFFVGQIQEWVIQPSAQTLPLAVWIGQTLYLLILAGLLIGFRWELAGGLLVVGAAVPLFANSEPLLIPMAIMPGLLYIACWFGGRPLKRQAHSADRPALSGLNAA
jgi:hypothetical protein